MKNYTFCPYCGGKHVLVQHDDSHYSCARCDGHLWDNPKAAVAVVFLNDRSEILVARRSREPQKDKFDLPGGFIEYNEDPFEAVIREVQEETGLHILSQPQLIDTFTHDYGSEESVCDLIMLVRRWQGIPTPRDDVASLYWKPISFIDEDKFAWPYTRLSEKLYQLTTQEVLSPALLAAEIA